MSLSAVLSGCLVSLALLPATQASPPGGKVTLPISDWEQMLAELEASARRDQPAVPAASIERTLRGRFQKGLFSGTLTVGFEVLDDRGHQRVPVLDGRASVGRVRLDGKPTSLLREGDLYTVGVDSAGRHTLEVELYFGREQDRFARRLDLRLPEGGSSRVVAVVPEQDIEARVSHGALIAQRTVPGGTEVEAQIDASGRVDVAWNRKVTHRAEAGARTEAQLHGVFTLHEALATGVAAVDVEVLEGETDRVDLELPAGLEVLRVEGEAVLQWRTEAAERGRLTVLLRYLVDDKTRFAIHFQLPLDPARPAQLSLPWPKAPTPASGAFGIQAPAGLNVRLAAAPKDAEELTPRDVPSELTDLTSSPLRYAFRFSAPPEIQLEVTRHEEVELTSTLIDEIQASTVVVESGMEVTKLKLRIRNNTRQYLTMKLPKNALLTHSLIDGQPVRPAITGGTGDRESLLLPLRQSERIGAGKERWHEVRPGETLSDIANFYYSDPTGWSAILNANQDQLGGPEDLSVGQRLNIPVREGTAVEESSFVIEVAYKRPMSPLSSFGTLGVELPEVDVDAIGAVWHLYFPASLAPLGFDSNLTQYSAIRYDPFRRLRDFIDSAFGIRHAWASGGAYKSILSQRKVIWREEAEKKGGDDVVLSSFPLVGERYRFKRILLGRETPKISVLYSARGLAGAARWIAFGLAFALTIGVVHGARSAQRRRLLFAAAAVALILLLIGAHFFLGVHRRIIWGVDLALLLAVLGPELRALSRKAREWVWEPWRLGSALTFGNLLRVLGVMIVVALVLSFPLFLSSIALLILVGLEWRRARRTAAEVGHV